MEFVFLQSGCVMVMKNVQTEVTNRFVVSHVACDVTQHG